MEFEMVKALADFGALGVLLAVIVFGYRLATRLSDHLFEIIKNHLHDLTAALLELRDEIHKGNGR